MAFPSDVNRKVCFIYWEGNKIFDRQVGDLHVATVVSSLLAGETNSNRFRNYSSLLQAHFRMTQTSRGPSATAELLVLPANSQNQESAGSMIWTTAL